METLMKSSSQIYLKIKSHFVRCKIMWVFNSQVIQCIDWLHESVIYKDVLRCGYAPTCVKIVKLVKTSKTSKPLQKAELKKQKADFFTATCSGGL